MSRIKLEERGVNLYDENDWDKMNAFIVSNIPNFEQAFREPIKGLKK